MVSILVSTWMWKKGKRTGNLKKKARRRISACSIFVTTCKRKEWKRVSWEVASVTNYKWIVRKKKDIREDWIVKRKRNSLKGVRKVRTLTKIRKIKKSLGGRRKKGKVKRRTKKKSQRVRGGRRKTKNSKVSS